METQTREFEGTWEELAMYEPEFRGKKLRLTVLPDSEKQQTTSRHASAPSARELLKSPAEERSRILAAQAALAEPLYRTDPELTAFEAFDEEDIYDDYPALDK